MRIRIEGWDWLKVGARVKRAYGLNGDWPEGRKRSGEAGYCHGWRRIWRYGGMMAGCNGRVTERVATADCALATAVAHGREAE
jgi:hypothetical protein